MILEFDRQLQVTPEAQIDERVLINQSIGGGLYAGYILGLTDNTILGNTNTTYGIWSSASKAGTRYNVISHGTPGNGEILIDNETGRLVANASVTVYVRYLMYARIFHYWETGDIVVTLPSELYNSSSEIVAFIIPSGMPTSIRGFHASFYQNLAANIVFAIRKTAGGADLETITISSGSSSGSEDFSNRLKFAADETIVVVCKSSTGALGIGPTITLKRG